MTPTEKLKHHVTGAVERGEAQAIVEQPTLQTLKERADRAGAAFDAECSKVFCDGRWGYYRAMEGVNGGEGVTDAMHRASDEYMKATHAYYSMRDGDKGFLGSRGL